MAHETYSLVKDVILADEQPPLTVKGFDKPVHCYKIVGIYDDLAEEGRIVRHQEHGIQIFVDTDKLTGDHRGKAIETLKDALAKLEDELNCPPLFVTVAMLVLAPCLGRAEPSPARSSGQVQKVGWG